MPADECQSHRGEGCCGGLNRRQFLEVTGASLMSLSALGKEGATMALSVEGPGPANRHSVPADKRLSGEWLQSLFARGSHRVFRGKELNRIGMPIGGIAAGQVYLCGDGTLACWQIFNQRYFSGYGQDNYRINRMPARPVDQGFAVVVVNNGETLTRRLDRQSWPAVEFVGEYAIGRVRYAEPVFPVTVQLDAFSPFIPLNSKDSALPATVLRYTVENLTDRPLAVAMVGWLENAIGRHSVEKYGLEVSRCSRVQKRQGRTLLVHTAEVPEIPGEDRPDIVLVDFEGDSYGDWQAEGRALGDGPAAGTLENQNAVTGYQGAGLVNTFAGGDDSRGRLTSPEFNLDRPYLNFLIGGGNHPGETCVNLLVDGSVVRTATGQSEERLLWHSWNVREFAGRPARIEIVDQRQGGWGHINVDQITLSDHRRFGTGMTVDQLEDFGSVTLAVGQSTVGGAEAEKLGSIVEDLGKNLQTEPSEVHPSSDSYSSALATSFEQLAPGERRDFTFVVAWHMPNREHGQRYDTWFEDAADVTHYVFDHLSRLTEQTRRWHDTFYDSTLPYWLLDRLHSTVGNLATNTCQWWKNGRFWAWEGVGCCHGTCTHVWNYAQALARLFPDLERSARQMQDLDVALHDDGLVGFRGEHHQAYAADGQCGTILKCYREHQMSADDAFLRRSWPNIRKVLDFCIGQDADDDGLIEGSQHNTYDINFEGANTFVGSLYLAALRAGEEMAREVGDETLAARLRAIFESGSRLSVERLWNGEYFIQDVDPAQHPDHQYGHGCLSDQLFGQGWARQLGLGLLYPEGHVRAALDSVWKYNWAPDVGPHNALHHPERWFASPSEAGLFTCTWPKSEHLGRGVRYRNEVWTGIEYQVAGHMIWEGMVEQGLAIVRGIHDRYDPLKHNPFNEVECGDHYARALASWGVYLALCGYEYHGPKAHLGFAPRITPEDFRAAFTAADGWGAFEQRIVGKSQRERIVLRWGQVRLASLSFSVPETIDRQSVSVTAGGKTIKVSASADGSRLTIRLAEELLLKEGDVLDISIGK